MPLRETIVFPITNLSLQMISRTPLQEYQLEEEMSLGLGHQQETTKGTKFNNKFKKCRSLDTFPSLGIYMDQ
jgi:hypothetical protein